MSINLLQQNIHKEFLILSLLFLPSFKCHDEVIYRRGRNFNGKITLGYHLKKQNIKHKQPANFSCACNFIICENP